MTMLSAPGAAQSSGGVTSVDSLVRVVRLATERYRDPAMARRDGYRPIGPDAPGMGQHWVNSRRALSSTVDPAHPAILSYVEIDSVPTLVGAAMLMALGPSDTPPSWPGGVRWHDHSGDLEEEGLGLSPMSGAANSTRMAMLHVWTWQANPDGALATDNWSLPFVRAGYEPPPVAEPEAARALSLLSNGVTFYAALLERVARPDSALRETIAATLALARHDVATLCRSERAASRPDAPLIAALRDRWRGLVASLDSVLPSAATHALSGHVEH
jgi:hypothetical protein